MIMYKKITRNQFSKISKSKCYTKNKRYRSNLYKYFKITVSPETILYYLSISSSTFRALFNFHAKKKKKKDFNDQNVIIKNK